MTEIESMALKQAVALLEKAAKDENRSLYSLVDDHCTTPSERLFQDYISEDEWWVADHLTDGVIGYIKESLQDLGWKMPE
jgi:hypothetical protein